MNPYPTITAANRSEIDRIRSILLEAISRVERVDDATQGAYEDLAAAAAELTVLAIALLPTEAERLEETRKSASAIARKGLGAGSESMN